MDPTSDLDGVHCQVRHVCLPQNDIVTTPHSRPDSTVVAKRHRAPTVPEADLSPFLARHRPSWQLHGTPNKALCRVIITLLWPY